MSRLEYDARATPPGQESPPRPPTEPMRQRRRAFPWVELVLLVAVSMPFAFAVLAHTSAPPRQPSPSIGPLPTSGTAADLGSEIDHVPLLADVPDAGSQSALDTYRRLGIFDGENASHAFVSAWSQLQVPDEDRWTVNLFALQLLDLQGYGVTDDDVDEIFDILASDPDNGARLTNAAVMLFGYAALIDSGIAPNPEGVQDSLTYHAVLERQAVLLLDAVAEHFGPSREQTLNQALFVSLVGSPQPNESAEDLAAAAVAADPADVTARWVLSNLQARRPDDARGYEDAVETVRPLLDNPGTRLLGEAATGDAYLAAASLRAAEAPRTSAILARRAIDHFDRVLHDVADPGAYAGRARALALLGDTDSAVAAMRQAVERAPRSVDLALDLAALQQAAGDVEAMRDTASDALKMTTDGWEPRLAEIRPVYSVTPSGLGLANPGDLGMFGASVGSTRDHIAVIEWFEGGGYLAGVSVVPTVLDPELDSWRRGGLAPDVAARLAIDASIALGDPVEANVAFNTWRESETISSSAATVDTWHNTDIVVSQELFDDVYAELHAGVWAAELVAGMDGWLATDVGEDVGQAAQSCAEAALRRAGQFADLEALCRRLLERTPAPLFTSDLVQCLGDSLVLQDRLHDAAENYADVIGESDPVGSLRRDPSVLLRWGAARLALNVGDERGRRLLEQAVVLGYDAVPSTALMLLGLDDLERGEPAVARVITTWPSSPSKRATSSVTLRSPPCVRRKSWPSPIGASRCCGWRRTILHIRQIVILSTTIRAGPPAPTSPVRSLSIRSTRSPS